MASFALLVLGLGFVDPLPAQLVPSVGSDDRTAELTVSGEEFPEHLRAGTPRSLGDLQALEKRVQSIQQKVRDATVSVSGGSGVVVTADGLVLTAAHVNQRAGRTVLLTFANGKRVRGVTLGNNTDDDAGMIQIQDTGEYPYLELSDQRPSRGTWCLAVGFPVSFGGGQQPPVRLGRVMGTGRSLIRTDCTIMGGDSGGPLVDLDGKLIGIHSKVRSDVDENLHVAMSSYTDDWDRLLASEDWGRNARPASGYLGVQRVDGVERALVASVISGSAAQQAGIRAGDEIIRLDGEQIRSFQHLVDRIGQTRAGQKVDIVVIRNGSRVEFKDVSLGKR